MLPLIIHLNPGACMRAGTHCSDIPKVLSARVSRISTKPTPKGGYGGNTEVVVVGGTWFGLARGWGWGVECAYARHLSLGGMEQAPSCVESGPVKQHQRMQTGISQSIACVPCKPQTLVKCTKGSSIIITAALSLPLGMLDACLPHAPHPTPHPPLRPTYVRQTIVPFMCC
jgi:hypothetical protein